jgi:endonuclease/exonuclease/phosphatase (EEP) superfamily protein YafD
MRRLIAALLLGLAIAGITVRFTVQDSSPSFAPLFYALPVPLIGALLIGGGWLARRPIRVLAVAAGLLTLGFWFVRDFGFAAPQTGMWKFMTWNLQAPRQPFAPLMDLVRRERPDFVSLVETGALSEQAIAIYEKALPGYRMIPLGGDRACLVRGESIVGARTQALSGRSGIVTMRVNFGGEWMNIFIVDLDSKISLSRRPALEWLTQAASRNPRTVVLGDFNTPLDSALLVDLRRRFTAAIEGRHSGFRETWFYGLPMLSLDQIWLSKDFRPVFAKRIWTLSSDHTPVMATFSPGR